VAKGSTKPPFPSKAEVLEFLKSGGQKPNKREIAKAFYIKGDDRIRLKKLLAEMTSEGLIEKDPKKSLRAKGVLPPVTIVEITGTDRYGDLRAAPIKWPLSDGDKSPPPRIFMVTSKRLSATLTKGDHALVRLSPSKDREGFYYSARLIKAVDNSQPSTTLGIYKEHIDRGKVEGRIHPISRKEKQEYIIRKDDKGTATDGALVRASILPHTSGRAYGLRFAKVVENLNDLTAPKSISLIALYQNEIPIEFSPDAVSAADAATPLTSRDIKPNDKRIDLTAQPFITIDPYDARDHDDAIMAKADDNPDNKDGWVISIAIADVAHYVTSGSSLDIEAKLRGNSCYLPDRVVPMLPEKLSTDLCSLRPDVERPAMVAHIWIDKHGNKIRHKFERAIIRSIANVNYQEVQAAMDGETNDNTQPLLNPVLKPLYSAFHALDAERTKRQPLALELPERKVILDDAGNVVDIIKRDRLLSHKLVEEYMIAANVAAAESLEKRNTPCMYRVHEVPSFEKLEGLREFLASLNINLAKGQVLKPSVFNNILKKVEGETYQDLVNQVVLRSQTQAYYSPENHGHFGLALPNYGHFTSPIRRYSDILVHRGLISAYGLGDDGLSSKDRENMVKIGEEISITERRAMAAERQTTDRYLAAYMKQRVGEELEGRISGVTRFGLFVTLEPSGADGLIPISSIGSDFYNHDEVHHQLVGRRTGICYRLGDVVSVRLLEADAISGSLRFELLEEGVSKKRPTRQKYGSKKHKKGRNKPRR
jgi:ribonuclease R